MNQPTFREKSLINSLVQGISAAPGAKLYSALMVLFFVVDSIDHSTLRGVALLLGGAGASALHSTQAQNINSSLPKAARSGRGALAKELSCRVRKLNESLRG